MRAIMFSGPFCAARRPARQRAAGLYAAWAARNFCCASTGVVQPGDGASRRREPSGTADLGFVSELDDDERELMLKSAAAPATSCGPDAMAIETPGRRARAMNFTKQPVPGDVERETASGQRQGVAASSADADAEPKLEDADHEEDDDDTYAAAIAGLPPNIILPAHVRNAPLLLAGRDPAGHRSGYVALLGRPNAGKSTLQNTLLQQELSIVSPRPQTTRQKVLGILSEPGYQIILLDTPGVIATRRNMLEAHMMSAVEAALSSADATLVILDAAHDPQGTLGVLMEAAKLESRDRPRIWAVVLNKTDLLPPGEANALAQWFQTHTGATAVFPVCALTGVGMDALRSWLVQQMPEGPSLYSKEVVSEHPERFFVAEIIRGKIFELYEQEIPYSCQVNIVTYKARRGSKDYIEADVLVEKATQKRILIGAAGSALKTLSTASREAVEAFVGKAVFLNLRVDVAADWREDSAALQRFGLAPPK